MFKKIKNKKIKGSIFALQILSFYYFSLSFLNPITSFKPLLPKRPMTLL